VKAVLRRSNLASASSSGQLLTYGAISLDLKCYEVRVGDEPVLLTPTELKLLAMFLREPGRVFTREQIVDQVFGREYDCYDRSVDTHISNLRRKISDSATDTQYIQTVYGIGYKFSHD
jgi:DNA-binding response OmpR family regulator